MSERIVGVLFIPPASAHREGLTKIWQVCGRLSRSVSGRTLKPSGAGRSAGASAYAGIGHPHLRGPVDRAGKVEVVLAAARLRDSVLLRKAYPGIGLPEARVARARLDRDGPAEIGRPGVTDEHPVLGHRPQDGLLPGGDGEAVDLGVRHIQVEMLAQGRGVLVGEAHAC